MITATILFIISILFSRVTVNVLVFVLRVVFFHLIVYIVTRYMYDAVRRDFALSASFVLESFDGSEVTTRQGNELSTCFHISNRPLPFHLHSVNTDMIMKHPSTVGRQ